MMNELMHLSDFAPLFGDATDVAFKQIAIDSRKVVAGDLFVALRGDRFDGHDYLLEAASKGAVACIVERPMESVSIPQLVVADALNTLQDMARLHRQKSAAKVIALTGSNGKTTVKEMIARILPDASYATRGNLNNHIGVPLSVLSLQSSHQYAVFELGANHVGEILNNVSMVQPDVALINNIAPAHVGEFGSIDAIARAKGEIFEGLHKGGVAIVNADDEYAHFWDAKLKDHGVLQFSIEKPVDVYASDIAFDSAQCARFKLHTPMGHASIALAVPGTHNIRNALAAAACCYAIGLPIEAISTGLQSFAGVSGRLMQRKGLSGALIIDDTYNANLRSVLAAIDVLSRQEGCRILVFGDMGELGPWAIPHHQEVGLAAKAAGIDKLYTVGELSREATQSFGVKGKHFATQDELARELQAELNDKTTVLIKGSRGSRMEKIVEQLIG